MDSRYYSSEEETSWRDGSRSKEASSSRSGSLSKHKSHRQSSDSPPSSKHKEERRSKDDKKYYDRHKAHRSKDRYSKREDKSRSGSPIRRRRSRSRSGKRSRSKSPRRYKDNSPKRSSEHDRSPRRKHYDPKSNKLTILEKMGIDLKVPEGEKGGTSSVLPSYYNPLVVNSAKYADQIAKRKLLWNNKKVNKEEGETVKNASIWQGAKFSQDQDGKMTAKFQRLMGMKEVPAKPTEQDGKVKELFKKQEELFSSMEMQYEVARATTHTQRGVGLGFGPRHIP